MAKHLTKFLHENYVGEDYLYPKSFQHNEDRELYWKFRVNLECGGLNSSIDAAAVKILEQLLNKNIEHKTDGSSTVVYPNNLAQAKQIISHTIPILLGNPDITADTDSYDTELVKGLSARYELCVKDMPSLVAKVAEVYEPLSSGLIGRLWAHYPKRDKDGKKPYPFSPEIHSTAKKLEETINPDHAIKRHNELNSKLQRILEEHLIERSISSLLPYNSACAKAPFYSIIWMLAATDEQVEPALYKLTYLRRPYPHEKELIENYFKAQNIMKITPEFREITKHLNYVLHRA
ncbi:MAG: hypothetical protein PHC66_04790 [Candidatus Nanoarchaeia archaeon]|nr:hypothetical protein [Candidatus Nanoarchaeia archaeon]MDD5238981.1 hypothetical protein [Candidatus Nanoarchaeia archaeon]